MNGAPKQWLLDLGLMVLRVTIGIVFIFHGAQKLFGVWEGPGLSNFAKYLEGMNVPAPSVSAFLAAATEFFGGVLVLVGVFTRLVTIPMIFTMLVAINATRSKGFSMQKNGFEFALVMGLLLLALLLTGPGRFVFWKPRQKKPIASVDMSPPPS